MSVLGNDVLFNFRAPQGMELQREQYVKIHLLSSFVFVGVFSVEGLVSFNCSSINSAAFLKSCFESHSYRYMQAVTGSHEGLKVVSGTKLSDFKAASVRKIES